MSQPLEIAFAFAFAMVGTVFPWLAQAQEAAISEAEASAGNARPAADDAELRYWLDNLARHHRYRVAEISVATGLDAAEVEVAMDRLCVDPAAEATFPAGLLKVLAYPGGRHPRIGFLDGAVRPQRETKVSVFTPWTDDDDLTRAGHVIVDVPEAIWSNLGLTYLAHSHVDTLWTRAGIELPKLEWTRHDDGRLTLERELPNGISYVASVEAREDHVRMELTLSNGTDTVLTDLRVQNCVMLKNAPGFTAVDNDNRNKVFSAPFAAVESESGGRWVITAWTPGHRAWGNVRVPCLHADPKFPDCPPGESRSLRGWLSFYQGREIEAEFQRILDQGWLGKDE